MDTKYRIQITYFTQICGLFWTWTRTNSFASKNRNRKKDEMALTTRTFKGQLAVDSEDCSIDVWLVVKPHWREARKSVAHFVPPSRFICHFFYQANTPVTKRVRLEERADQVLRLLFRLQLALCIIQNELLLVDGALVVSEMQLEWLLEAGEFVRLRTYAYCVFLC
jgi:hypothetical protein